MNSEWIIAGASVTGSSHGKTASPCQDASAIRLDDDGKWVAIAVSDGAGTARCSQQGSELVANFFANSLIGLTKQFQSRLPGAWINDFVIEKILEVRRKLREVAGSDDIRDYHCTLVACLVGPERGFAIHIGDGAVFGGQVSRHGSSSIAELNSGFFISPPENGEYANETFFVTEGDWVKRLRITALPHLDWVFVATDGGTALSLVSDKEPKAGFLVPVLKGILCAESTEARNESLRADLADLQADKITGDDKTIAIACRSNVRSLADWIQFQSTKESSADSTTTPNTSPPQVAASAPENAISLVAPQTAAPSQAFSTKCPTTSSTPILNSQHPEHFGRHPDPAHLASNRKSRPIKASRWHYAPSTNKLVYSLLCVLALLTASALFYLLQANSILGQFGSEKFESPAQSIPNKLGSKVQPNVSGKSEIQQLRRESEKSVRSVDTSQPYDE